MSTVRIVSEVNQTQTSLAMRIELKFTISFDLHTKLQKSFHPNLLIYNDQQSVSIEELSITLDRINLCYRKHMKDEDRITLEEYKIAIMNSILNSITTQKENDSNKDEDKKKNSGFLFWLKLIFYSPVAVVGMIQGGIMTFLGIRTTILSFFPALSSAILLPVSLAVTLLDSIQSFAFQMDLLKHVTGLSFSRNLLTILSLQKDQIKLVKKINLALDSRSTCINIDNEKLSQLAGITHKFNADLKLRNEDYNHEEKHLHPAKKYLRNGLKIGLAIFSAAMNVIGVYYGATMLLTALAAPLLATPIGWTIIGLLIFFSLALHIVAYVKFRSGGIENIISPTLNEFNVVKKKLNKFSYKTEKDFHLNNEDNKVADQVINSTNDHAKTIELFYTPETDKIITNQPQVNEQDFTPSIQM